VIFPEVSGSRHSPLVLVVSFHTRGSVANRSQLPSLSKGATRTYRRCAKFRHAQLELLFAIPAGRAQCPSQACTGATHNLLACFHGATTSKPSRRWRPPRVTSTTGLQLEHLVPLDATSRCNRTRITHFAMDSQSSKHKRVRGLRNQATLVATHAQGAQLQPSRPTSLL
jgi:hypothetical protein